VVDSRYFVVMVYIDGTIAEDITQIGFSLEWECYTRIPCANLFWGNAQSCRSAESVTGGSAAVSDGDESRV